jgi:hypothetical protein
VGISAKTENEEAKMNKVQINERIVHVRLVGVTPLLMHNPIGMSIGGTAKTRRIPTPEEEAKAGLYASDDGRLYVKFIAIRTCAMAGAKALKVGKMSGARFLAGCLLNVDLDAPCWLYDPDTGRPLTQSDYVIDLRRVVVQHQGVVRARPKIMTWATEASFIFDASQVSRPEELDLMLIDALQRGGQVCGIGDYRPERSGPFGRFYAELVNGVKAYGK